MVQNSRKIHENNYTPFGLCFNWSLLTKQYGGVDKTRIRDPVRDPVRDPIRSDPGFVDADNMGHCRVSDMMIQGNRCWSAMYVINLSEPQRRTILGYSCLYISMQYNFEVIFTDSLKYCKILYYIFTLTEKKMKKALNFLEDLAGSELGYDLICNSR